MRLFITRSTLLAMCVVLATVVLSVAPASANHVPSAEYPPHPQPSTVRTCGDIPVPSVSVTGANGAADSVNLNWSSTSDVVSVNLKLDSTVIFNGKLPANGKISAKLPAGVAPGHHTVTIFATLRCGGTYYQSTTVTVAGRAAPAPVAAPAAVPAVAAQVAFTGSETDLSLMAGFSLIGVGGLALAESRRRKHSV